MSDTRLQTSLDQVLSIPSVRAEHPNLHAGATAELATLRAQLAEARDILIVLAYIDNMLSPEEKHEFVSVSIKTSTIRAARAWYNKVTTA